jgi:hypothetical protein
MTVKSSKQFHSFDQVSFLFTLRLFEPQLSSESQVEPSLKVHEIWDLNLALYAGAKA